MHDFCVAPHGGREMICQGVSPLLAVDELGLPGRHNVLNVMAALAMADAAGVNIPVASAAAKQFSGLAHRCELVAKIGGVSFINDSKATNVGACIAALQGFAQPGKRLVLIAGGQTKSADFAPLAKVVAATCSELVLLGSGADEIAKACRAVNADSPEINFATNMDEAVALAARAARPGDIVLLSPACASFDMYSGFEARGNAFRQAVEALAGGGRA
ncbi:MAG: UDP-N-acetylmuramoyl-L-alanine--D-glutamate ligase, partial [Pseudomonadales bacterium]|nr:UDP-N-acetylmuramoyl-L-alanine--D-glutamate ligase [Pseudomonadales bacterium]